MAAVPVSPPTALESSHAVSPALARLTTEELIDRLPQEDQEFIGTYDAAGRPDNGHWHVPAFVRAFLPVEAPARFEEVLSPEKKSPVMTELVRRGVAALPSLLDHLSDRRPTFISRQAADIGFTAFADNFDYRYADPALRPFSVNTIHEANARPLPSKPYRYIFTVGDLCFTAVGQIVNRKLSVSGQCLTTSDHRPIMHTSALISPTQNPALAAATRADWGGLTAAEHEADLRNDALLTDAKGYPGVRSWGAVRRLLFYYPAAGRKVARELLARTLVDGETDHALGPNQSGYSEKIELVYELAPVRWSELDPVIWELYRTAVRQRPTSAGQLKGRDELAFACAIWKPWPEHAKELREFFAARIPANEVELANPKTGYRYALDQSNRHYREFIAKLEPHD